MPRSSSSRRSEAASIGFGRDHAERGGGEEVLRHAAPQIPDRLDRQLFLAGDERLRVEAGELAELAQEIRCREDAHRRLQVRFAQLLAQLAAELAVQTDVDVGFGEVRYFLEVRAQREHHVHLAADPFHQAADLGEVGRHVEGAVDRADQVDPRLGLRRARLALGLGITEFVPQPDHRALGALPLVLVDGAGDEAPEVGAFRRDAAADHFGDAAGDHHRRHRLVAGAGGAAHRPLGAGHREIVLRQTGHDDRQFVRRQRVGVMQHRGHRQVFAADRPVDHHAQALHRGEGVNRAPVAARPVMVLHQHRVRPPPRRARKSRSCARTVRRRRSAPRRSPAARRHRRRRTAAGPRPCW